MYVLIERINSLKNSKQTEADGKASFKDLFRTPNMRVKSLSIFFNWMVCGMGLFGMTQYLGNVGGDIYFNFALTGAIQIPGNLLAWWTMNTFGRRVTLMGSNLITGISGICLIFVSKGEFRWFYLKSCFFFNDLFFIDLHWLQLVFASFGIVGMSVSFTTVYLYSSELFPTVIRNIGVGTSSMCARIGSMAAPHVVGSLVNEVLTGKKGNKSLKTIFMLNEHEILNRA